MRKCCNISISLNEILLKLIKKRTHLTATVRHDWWKHTALIKEKNRLSRTAFIFFFFESCQLLAQTFPVSLYIEMNNNRCPLALCVCIERKLREKVECECSVCHLRGSACVYFHSTVNNNI